MFRTLSEGSTGSVRRFGTGESRYLFVGEQSHSRLNYPRLLNPLGHDLVQPVDGFAVQPVRDLDAA